MFSLFVAFVGVAFAALSPSDLRAALVAGGMPTEALAANFTCVPAFQFDTLRTSRYACQNNVIVSLNVNIDANLTSLVLPDIDCLGVTTRTVSRIDTNLFFSSRSLLSLTFGAIRNCHRILIGNSLMRTITFGGVLTNVTELDFLGSTSLRDNVTIVARDAPGFAGSVSCVQCGNFTTRFGFSYSTNASILNARFDDSPGIASIRLEAAVIGSVACTRNAFVTSLSLPQLVNSTALVVARCGSLKTISAPLLKILDGTAAVGLDIEHNSELTTFDMPQLSAAKAVDFLNNSGVTSLFLPALARSVSTRVRYNAGLTLITLTSLADASTLFELDANLKLTSLDVSSLANARVTVTTSPVLKSLSFPAVRKPSTMRVTNCSTLASISFGAAADLRTFVANDNPALSSITWPTQAAFDSIDLAGCAFAGAVPANLPTAPLCTLQRAGDSNCFDCSTLASNCTCVQCPRLVPTSAGATTASGSTTSGSTTTASTTSAATTAATTTTGAGSTATTTATTATTGAAGSTATSTAAETTTAAADTTSANATTATDPSTATLNGTATTSAAVETTAGSIDSTATADVTATASATSLATVIIVAASTTLFC